MAVSLQASVQDQIADVTECSICTEVFTNPKSLPCLHSFCLNCLENYGMDKKPGDQMACPICRSSFCIPNGGFSNLPSNFFIGKMVEIRKLGSAATIGSLCATCPEEERIKATLFCLECEQNLCQRCGVIHNKMKLSHNHQVVEIGSKPQEVTFRNSYCDQHPGELVKMYCEDDNATICFLCFAESHQTHKCLSVNKAAEKFSSALKNDFARVKQRLPGCKDSLEKLKKLKISLLEETAEAEQKILSEATRLKTLVDCHANALTQKLTEIKDRKLKEIENTMNDSESYEIMIESYSRYLDKLMSKGAPGDICIEGNKLKARAEVLTAMPEMCCGCFRCWSEIKFIPSNSAHVVLINNISNTIGDVQSVRESSQLLGHSIEKLRQRSEDSEIRSIPASLEDDLRINNTANTGPNCAVQTVRLFSRSTKNQLKKDQKYRPIVTSEVRPAYPKEDIVVQNFLANFEDEILRPVLQSKCSGGGEVQELDLKIGRSEKSSRPTQEDSDY